MYKKILLVLLGISLLFTNIAFADTFDDIRRENERQMMEWISGQWYCDGGGYIYINPVWVDVENSRVMPERREAQILWKEANNDALYLFHMSITSSGDVWGMNSLVRKSDNTTVVLTPLLKRTPWTPSYLP
jgi:hypothetical protein